MGSHGKLVIDHEGNIIAHLLQWQKRKDGTPTIYIQDMFDTDRSLTDATLRQGGQSVLLRKDGKQVHFHVLINGKTDNAKYRAEVLFRETAGILSLEETFEGLSRYDTVEFEESEINAIHHGASLINHRSSVGFMACGIRGMSRDL